MASGLKGEQEKYQQFVEELDKLTKGSNNEASSAALEHGQTLINTYIQDLTVNGLVNGLSTWQPDTPEEIETLEKCLRVRHYSEYEKASICLYSDWSDGLWFLQL